MALKFKISGIVTELESGLPLADLLVRAYDKDLIYDDLLSDAFTDREGHFEMHYEEGDFQELFDDRPDIYFKILDKSGIRVLHTTSDSVRWNSGTTEFFDIKIPGHKLPPAPGFGITLIDSQGKYKNEFEAGDSLMVNFKGLTPETDYRVQLLDDSGDEIFSSILLANRFGVIAPTVLWPDIGIGVPGEGGKFAFETFEKVAEKMGKRKFSLRLSMGKETIGKTAFTIAGEITSAKLYSASVTGALKRGLLLGRTNCGSGGQILLPVRW